MNHILLTKHYNTDKIKSIYDDIKIVDIAYTDNTIEKKCILYKEKCLEVSANKTEKEIASIMPSNYRPHLIIIYNNKTIIDKTYSTIWDLERAIELYTNQFNYNIEIELDSITNDIL